MSGLESRLRWKKPIVIVVVLVAVVIAASYSIFGLLDAGKLNPVALLILAAVISIGLPMLRSNFFPSRRDCETEYAFHEQRLEKEITQSITDGIGPNALNRIFSAPGHYRDAANERINHMLESEEALHNPELRFALLMALARYEEKIGDPEAGIPVLRSALKIKPQHFVARMHLAGNYEWIGASDEALRQYQELLDEPQNLTVGMKKLVVLRRNALQAEKPPST